MSLLTAGYWPVNYWSDRYFADGYWPDYGVPTQPPYSAPVLTVSAIERDFSLTAMPRVFVLIANSRG
ncbi:MAG: hypothetical protein AB1568_04805 [Thermodesulfobacteriota bacterium]